MHWTHEGAKKSQLYCLAWPIIDIITDFSNGNLWLIHLEMHWQLAWRGQNWAGYKIGAKIYILALESFAEKHHSLAKYLRWNFQYQCFFILFYHLHFCIFAKIISRLTWKEKRHSISDGNFSTYFTTFLKNQNLVFWHHEINSLQICSLLIQRFT